MNKKEIAIRILNRLESQKFADWYNPGGKFDDYITGELKAPTKQEILNEIEKMFLNWAE
jgi:hypothetical protein